MSHSFRNPVVGLADLQHEKSSRKPYRVTPGTQENVAPSLPFATRPGTSGGVSTMSAGGGRFLTPLYAGGGEAAGEDSSSFFSTHPESYGQGPFDPLGRFPPPATSMENAGGSPPGSHRFLGPALNGKKGALANEVIGQSLFKGQLIPVGQGGLRPNTTPGGTRRDPPPNLIQIEQSQLDNLIRVNELIRLDNTVLRKQIKELTSGQNIANQLQDQVTALEKEIKDLLKELSTTKTELRRMTEENKTLFDRHQDVNSEFSDFKTEHENCQDLIDGDKEILDKMKFELVAARGARDNFKKTLAHLETVKARQDHEIKDLKQRLDLMTEDRDKRAQDHRDCHMVVTELSNLRKEYYVLKETEKKFVETKALLQSTEDKLTKQSSEVNTANTQLNKRTDIINDLRERLAVAEAEHAGCGSKIKHLEKNIVTFREELVQKEIHYSKAMEETSAKMEKLELKVETSMAEKVQGNTKEKETEKAMEVATEKLDEVTKAHEELVAITKEMPQKITALEAEKKENTMKIAILGEAKAGLEKEVARLTKLHEPCADRLASITAEVARLKNEKDKAEKTLMASLTQKVDAEQALSLAEGERDDVRKRFESLYRTHASCTEVQKDLERRLHSHNACEPKYVFLEGEFNQALFQNKALQGEILEKIKQEQEMQEKYDQLKGDFQKLSDELKNSQRNYSEATFHLEKLARDGKGLREDFLKTVALNMEQNRQVLATKAAVITGKEEKAVLTGKVKELEENIGILNAEYDKVLQRCVDQNAVINEWEYKHQGWLETADFLTEVQELRDQSLMNLSRHTLLLGSTAAALSHRHPDVAAHVAKTMILVDWLVTLTKEKNRFESQLDVMVVNYDKLVQTHNGCSKLDWTTQLDVVTQHLGATNRAVQEYVVEVEDGDGDGDVAAPAGDDAPMKALLQLKGNLCDVSKGNVQRKVEREVDEKERVLRMRAAEAKMRAIALRLQRESENTGETSIPTAEEEEALAEAGGAEDLLLDEEAIEREIQETARASASRYEERVRDVTDYFVLDTTPLGGLNKELNKMAIAFSSMLELQTELRLQLRKTNKANALGVTESLEALKQTVEVLTTLGKKTPFFRLLSFEMKQLLLFIIDSIHVIQQFQGCVYKSNLAMEENQAPKKRIDVLHKLRKSLIEECMSAKHGVFLAGLVNEVNKINKEYNNTLELYQQVVKEKEEAAVDELARRKRREEKLTNGDR